jgi:hypothetical protein
MEPVEEEEDSLAVDMDMPQPDELDKLAESPVVAVLGPGPETPLRRKCALCEEEEHLQAKEVPGKMASTSADIGDFRGGGRPLDASVRSFFEPRFGYVFDQVRVHTDERAAESAQAVNALAYTVGHDIVFGAGHYAPDTTEGRRLIAHELTHVVQQDPARTLMGFSGLPNRPVRVQAATTDSTILQRWSVNGPANSALNTIVCDGSGGIRVQLGGTGDADQTRCLSDCMRRHEESHRADALAADANLCKGKADGSQVNMNGTAEQSASEIKASNAEINCLTPQVSKVGPVCKSIIERRIKQMETYRDSFK